MHQRQRKIRYLVLVAVLAIAMILPATGAEASTRTPVRGKSQLTEAQLLNWFANGGWRPEFRVPGVTRTELIDLYRQEGENEGMAWDVAFMQAILETGWFNFPGGQVEPGDYNFAGMGAFDSGTNRPYQFPTVRMGVRAQMQHLRLYSDPDTNLQGTNLGSNLAEDIDDPPRYPPRWRTVRGEKLPDGSYRYAGRVPAWQDFGNGMWATDPFYSCKVLNLYRQALDFNGKDSDGLPTSSFCLQTWHLRFQNSGGAGDAVAHLGQTGDHILACDWDGNGTDTPATFSGATWTISNQQNGGGTRTIFRYGRAGDLPLCGDWNGNGFDTVGVVRDGTWHLKDSLSGGVADRSFVYGRVTQGDMPIVGNWNGKNGDGVGIIRGGDWHLRQTPSSGVGQISFRYGRVTGGDLPIVGDWNKDGKDGVGVVRGRDWHLKNGLSGGVADKSFSYGRVDAGDVPVTGDWTGDGTDTPAIVR